MNKTGGSTVFMLGVAGMGLAVAMFFDARKPLPTEIKAEPVVTPAIAYEEPMSPDLDSKAMTPVESEEPLVTIVEAEEESTDKEEEEVIDYKTLYLKAREKEREALIKAGPDNSYKGDGSEWSKKLYFIKEAYRRSREATPVDPAIKQRVKYGKMNKKHQKHSLGI